MTISHKNAPLVANGLDRQRRLQELAQQLINIEVEMEQLSNGQIDAIVSPEVGPILLRDARDTLRFSEQRFRSVFDNALDAMLVADDDGRYLDANPAASALFGLPHYELLGKRIEDFAGPEESASVNWKELQAAAETPCEFVLVRADGSQRITEFSVVTGIMPGQHLSILRDVTARKLAEEELRQSNQTLQTLLEAAPLAIQTLDLDGKVQFWNSAAEAMFGYARAEVIGRFVPIVSAEDQTSFVSMREHAGQGNRFVDVEIRPQRKGGAQIDVSVSAAPLYDAKGKLSGTISMFADIGERKQHERERDAILALATTLRTSVSRAEMVPVIVSELFTLFGAAGAALVVHDADTGESNFELARGELASLNGLRLARDEGMTGYVIRSGRLYLTNDLQADPNFAQLTKSRFLRAAAGIPLMVAHGETIGVLWLCSEQEIQASDLRLLATVADMVANALYRVTLYEQIQSQARQMQQVTDTVVEGLLLLDGENSIRLANVAATEYLAQLTTAVLGERLTHLGDQAIHSLLAPPPAGQLYHEVMGAQPMCSIFTVTATPMQADLGAESHVLVLRDVTEERLLQRRALQQDKLAAIGELAAGIAHDFNNILTPVLLYTDMTMNHMEPQSRGWSNLQQVLRATQRAKDLVAQILTFSRETTHQRQPVEVRAVIEEVLKLMRAVLPATIEMRQELDPAPSTILADPTQMHQVLMNLCTNAYHAMRSQGGVLILGLNTVTIEADALAQHGNLPAGDYLRITVSDTGHGMDEATRERIFEPFFTTKAIGQGTGMGLAVVYGIIADFGGSISVDSRLGHGTTFQIYLPKFASHLQFEEATVRPLLPGTERILLIEDEEVIAHVATEMLESFGYQVTARTNSIEAVALFRSAPDQFDLVITDLTMPRMTGVEVAIELLRLRPGLPILLMSGTGEVLTPAMVHSSGFRSFLSKPFTPNDLSWTIRQILDEGQIVDKG